MRDLYLRFRRRRETRQVRSFSTNTVFWILFLRKDVFSVVYLLSSKMAVLRSILYHILITLSACFSALNANGSSVEENFKKLARANSHLALAICKKLSSGASENVFFSPFSLSSAFGMVRYGATGETAKELRNVLGYDAAGITDDQVHESFHNYLTQAMNRKDDDYDLNLANAIFVDKRMELVSDYRKNVQNLYQAKIREVDFASDAKKAVKEVNELVRSVTQEKIKSILDESNLNAKTVMVVLNAVYFKGMWKTPFMKYRTFAETFYNSGLESEARQIPMMHTLSDFPYTADDDCQALELPYKGGNISMMVLLPHEKKRLAAFESKLTVEKLNAIRQQLNTTKVKVTFPKFKVEYSKEVSNAFHALGAKKGFHPGAELSGMSRNSAIYVSEVFHKAVFETDEEGSEAAAATAIIIVRKGLERLSFVKPPEFKVNRPFLFTILDKRNDMILFMGRIKTL